MDRQRIAEAGLPAELRAKHERLQKIIEEMGRAMVAFSGGVDSTLLLKVAADLLGSRAVAVTAVSATLPAAERQAAAEFARSIRVAHLEIDSRELSHPAFIDNPPDKCYICKKIRFEGMIRLASERGIPWVADGRNVDDDADYRPGSRAAGELGIRSPLREAGMTKAEIRELSRFLGLPTWNKPADACLASRIPYGHSITPEKLRQVDAGEAFIRGLGLPGQIRVRHEGDTARIEVAADAMGRFMEAETRGRVVTRLKALGFKFVALDLEGYATGSLNRLIGEERGIPPETPGEGEDHG